ncbi:unnamed protein product [Fusarium graminearum]|uniref:Chromosome 3, complete genome n=1 Tax=Gibberella zeae (strain ATCC MYA-4620 / CBS 123657 / FGSC 9075 / NRRL 31084 / PH-1) TaxID=229533 RepID=A0A098E4S9_GIBZE|nr:unnamed protein product [Fusarium graminearum]CZS84238.1 unnamed protein product [Fusarium graminearum]
MGIAYDRATLHGGTCPARQRNNTTLGQICEVKPEDKLGMWYSISFRNPRPLQTKYTSCKVPTSALTSGNRDSKSPSPYPYNLIVFTDRRKPTDLKPVSVRALRDYSLC